MFGVVVVPRHSVMMQESKQLDAVSLEPVFAVRCLLAVTFNVNELPVETVHVMLMFMEEVLLESALVHRVDYDLGQLPERRDYSLQLLVVGMIKNLCVEVSNQVDQAFLLRAIEGVVC